MNKKDYRLIGTISSEDCMQNLIADLKNAKNMSTSSEQRVSGFQGQIPHYHNL